MIPQNKPTKKPPPTSFKVCCRTMIRADPNIPASKIKPHSHQIGLNWKMKLYESRPPIIMPQLAMWVLIFHFRLMLVQITMQSSVAIIIPLI